MATENTPQNTAQNHPEEEGKKPSVQTENRPAGKKTDIFKISFFALVGLIIILSVFNLGMIVGEKKADFTRKWSDNYHMNFAGPKEGFFNDFGQKDFIEANGTFGQIIKIDGSTIVVKGQNDVEKTIIVSEETQIKKLKEDVKLEGLEVDDMVVIIGEPNDAGQIEAKFIRIMPPPPEKDSFRGPEKQGS